MVKKILGVLIAILILPVLVYAEDLSVPHFLNYQSLLYDDGGNLLPDGPTDMTLKVTDASGAVLYEERQTVDVVHGAVSALVGNGLDSSGAPVGGIPASVLSPDSGRYLEVTVDGYPPEASMEIVSVPYAVYAEKALGAVAESITGEALAKKSITIDHLADGLINDLATQMGTAGLIATRTDLTNLQTTYRGTTGASTIGVTGGFVYSGSNNLQGVLQDMDRAIQTRQAGVDAVQNNITNEGAARVAADTTLQTNLNSHAITNVSTAHPNGSFPISRLDTDVVTQSELNAEAAARGNADANEAAARGGVDQDHEERLVRLEQPDSRPHPSAWGTVSLGGNVHGYNVAEIVSGGPGGYIVSFSTPMANTNYAVIVTSRSSETLYIINKTVNDFTLGYTGATFFDFIVIGP